LYASKPEFRDRLSLFTEGVKRKVRPPAKLLDFGCGPGVMALSLGREGYDVHGVDGSSLMIDAAKRNQQISGVHSTSFECLKAGDADLGNEVYDAALCSSVLEYIEDDIAVLMKLASAVKVGGYLLVSLPHTRSIVGRIEEWLRKKDWYRQRQGRQFLGYSLRRYEPRTMLRTLEGLGLGDFEVTYFESPFDRWHLGAYLSRRSMLGVLMLVNCRKLKAV
jgi:SAM-dependent methyltransferase